MNNLGDAAGVHGKKNDNKFHREKSQVVIQRLGDIKDLSDRSFYTTRGIHTTGSTHTQKKKYPSSTGPIHLFPLNTGEHKHIKHPYQYLFI